MTPNPHFSCPDPVDDTGEILNLIADDTEDQLRRWNAINTLLRHPAILPLENRDKITALTDEVIRVLHVMRECSKEALRSFDEHGFHKCLHALERFERHRHALVIIGQVAARAVITGLTEETTDGHRR